MPEHPPANLTCLIQFSFSQPDLPSQSLHYDLPLQWSINKIKCFLQSSFPKLEFDTFELSYRGEALNGNLKLNQLQGLFPQTKPAESITLMIIKQKSEVEFSEYYKKTMGAFLTKSKYNNQPLLSDAVQSLMNLDSRVYIKLIQPSQYLSKTRLIRRLTNKLLWMNSNTICLLIAASLFCMVAMAFLITGTLQQNVFFWMFFTFYPVTEFVKAFIRYGNTTELIIFAKKNRQLLKQQMQNQLQGQGQPKDPKDQGTPPIKMSRKQQILWSVSFFLVRLYDIYSVFIWTLCPNLSVDDYIEFNLQKLNRVRRKANELFPGTYKRELAVSKKYNTRVLYRDLR